MMRAAAKCDHDHFGHFVYSYDEKQNKKTRRKKQNSYCMKT